MTCPTCDQPIATDADLDGCIDGCQCTRCISLCWRAYDRDRCTGIPIDWRARALTAESAIAGRDAAIEALTARVAELMRSSP